ncbi:MAG TPA: peroxiredoxin-like family protein [Nitrososphaerales archaeon]|nr:peroxiredoxin-like family protein [Nitrososphaerales archaeon]
MPGRPVAEESFKSAENEWFERYKNGPRRTRIDKLPPQEGDPAPDFRLKDQTGRVRRLSEFWKAKPALILFWRQFGCGCGIGRAERLREENDSYMRAGAEVVIVGQGEPVRAKIYAEKYSIPCPILSDPGFRAYKAYGLREGGPVEINYDAPEKLFHCDPQAGVELQRARREAGRPLVDNPWQLPGEFVISPAGLIRFAYRYQYCDNYPNPLVLISAIKDVV